MARIHFPGMRVYEGKIESLGRKGRDIAGRAVYYGAGVVADAIRESIQTSIPETAGEKGGTTKKGLLDGLGVAEIRDDNGFYNVKIGFVGYNAAGRPNALMARVFESGTSKQQKRPFIRPAVIHCKKQAEAAMAKTADEEIEKIMKG